MFHALHGKDLDLQEYESQEMATSLPCQLGDGDIPWLFRQGLILMILGLAYISVINQN